MNPKLLNHLIGWVTFGVPLWLGVGHMWFVLREYSPHIHEHDENGNPTIRYPRGFGLGKVTKL